MVMRLSLLSLLMLTVRRCCVSAWVATSHHAHSSQTRASLPFRQATPQLHPAFLRCRGGNSDAAAFSAQTVVSASSSSSSRTSAADVVATSNAEDTTGDTDPLERHTTATTSSTYPSPESLQHLGGAFTPRQFGGLSYWDTSSLDKFRVIFVLGGPGAGKGTQSTLMEENYPVVHLSVGQLLRDEQTKEGSPHRELIEKCLVAGQIVPVEISLQLVQTAMKEASAINGKQLLFLVDGFPRNDDNLTGWAKVMPSTAAIGAVLVYQCPLQVLEERILERAKQSGRSDDNLSSVQKRFTTFERDTVPVITTLRQAAALSNQWSVVDVRGDQPKETVWIASQQVLNELILHDVLTANAALLRAVELGDVAQYESVCDTEWFVGARNDTTEDTDIDVTVASIMTQQEGAPAAVGEVSRAQLDFISGKHVAVSYDRVLQGEVIREKRIWSHQGQKGWRNVHFARTPIQ